MLCEELTAKIIACCLEVHLQLGPGLLESVYETALCIELAERGLRHQNQARLPVSYKGKPIGDYRMDLLVEDTVVVELKSTERDTPLYEAQLLSYMKLGGYRVGLLINFNTVLLSKGIRRFVL
ncbi:GxxExxY protein [Geomonas sp. Red32]|uniref:GxxExxY protein n=1 Tax=Geomonas sp. Red32 TaxID=2912856 RepID=UPI00202CCC7E|nr:GxxExxY protein [Geomonas sp. Red32]MCM0084040.1 GxxExxY protein [Geomonas sp. Red32]